MKRKVQYGFSALKSIQRGMNLLADAVQETFGPSGRYVAFDGYDNEARVTNDGITVVKEFYLEDKFENLGARILANGAKATNQEVDDGTSTTTIIARSVANEAIEYLYESVSASPSKIEKELDESLAEVLTLLKEEMIEPKVLEVATIAAKDAEIGKIVEKAVLHAGKDGVVSVERSDGEDELELITGFKIGGAISPYLTSDETEVSVLVFNKPDTNTVISAVTSLYHQGHDKFLIIAKDFPSELITWMVSNNNEETKIVAVKETGKDNLEDICDYTKAKNYQDKDSVGKIKLISRVDGTVLIGGDSSKVEKLKKILADTKSAFDKKKLEQRISNLSGLASVIRVGGLTDVEVSKRMDAYQDAVPSAKMTVKEGSILGGGVSLKRVAEKMNTESKGAELLSKALKLPYELIGESEAVYDSLAVVRTAIENAVSTAKRIFTVGVAMTIVEEKND